MLLMDEPLTPDRFVELASLAESLGRRFEARGWWTLHARRAPSDHRPRQALARLGQTRGNRARRPTTSRSRTCYPISIRS